MGVFNNGNFIIRTTFQISKSLRHRYCLSTRQLGLKTVQSSEYQSRVFLPTSTSFNKSSARSYSFTPQVQQSKKIQQNETSQKLSQTATNIDDGKHGQNLQPAVNESEPEKKGLIREIFQRFKDAYKEYGKTLVVVHCVTSSVWFGTFFYAAASGLDISTLLQKIGTSEHFIEQLSSSGIGNAAVAYLMYKLATPARYTVTIVGTQVTVKYLRKLGYITPVPEGDSIRELLREGKSEMTVKYNTRKDVVKDRIEEMKGKADEMRDDMKERFKDKTSDIKNDFNNVGRDKTNLKVEKTLQPETSEEKKSTKSETVSQKVNSKSKSIVNS